MTEITIHRCTGLRLVRTFASNGNSVTLGITDCHGGETEIVLYGLPAEVTDKLNILRDADTQDFRDAGTDVATDLQNAGIVERVAVPDLPDGVEAYEFKTYSDAAQGE
jgi:hypothetical protein